MTRSIAETGAGNPQLDAEAAAERIARLLSRSPGQGEHAKCGVVARPCRDCRRTAPLECVDPTSCGQETLCRPCAATWRCRIWKEHLVHTREFHVACDRFPALANLHADPATAAAIWRELRRAIRRDVMKWVQKRCGGKDARATKRWRGTRR